MDAEIEGEDEEYVKVYITDNAGTEHDITIEKTSGKAVYHAQDGYPDKTVDRTYDENEHVAQARRFAKFYVYRKRGYDAMPPLPNPDRIAAVAAVIDTLSEDDFETYFGDYYQQLRSEFDAAQPVVEVPEAARTNPMFFQKDVYLDLSADEVRDFVTDADETTVAFLEDVVAVFTDQEGDVSDRLAALAADTDRMSAADRKRLAAHLIEAVSGVHVMWSPPVDGQRTQRHDVPDIDRKPDARFELPAYELDSLEEFRQHLLGHLRCQIRDCYLTMGIAPPKSVRIRGPGWFDRSTWYEHYGVYEPYHRDDVEISSWQEEYTPDEMLDQLNNT